MSFTSVQKIRFDDVDGAGIVYYPQFFHLCHAAFEDFLDTVASIPYPVLIGGGPKDEGAVVTVLEADSAGLRARMIGLDGTVRSELRMPPR